MLTDKYFFEYKNQIKVDIETMFAKLKMREWSADNFRFYTAVSVMSSARIEGEPLDIDSYVKHKLLKINYLENLTEKPNDLYRAYEFARDNKLTAENLFAAHSLATQHLLPKPQRGAIRSGNMIIMEQQTNRVEYEAADAKIVKAEFKLFFEKLNMLIDSKLTIDEIFYFASLIHLTFVKIHPFNDGNGRTGRLLEKWFLATKLGEKAWYVGSENYYYQNLKSYYHNLSLLGLFYDELNYYKSTPFLLMLPNSLV